MTSTGLPDLTAARAVLFDLDGVLTPTAEVHMRAWRALFEALFEEWDITPPYTNADYYTHLDGRTRYEGVAALLRSRDVELHWGDPSDAPDAKTVCGVGNRKNAEFAAILRTEGIAPFPGSLALMDALDAAGVPAAVVSSSKNAEEVLQAAGIRDRFPVVVDGVVAAREHLASKPAPAIFLRAAELLEVDPADCAVVEDAISGVQAAAAGGFGIVVGVDRGVGEDALSAAGATVVVSDLDAFTP